mmetsp:Transcript_29350/g.77598  ORF Transcript_29350/g.77598 Transcript_29350/m.77598 type:complete len:223 (+) Transcript_29350:177-845(+)
MELMASRRGPWPKGITGPLSVMPTRSRKLPGSPVLPGLCAMSMRRGRLVRNLAMPDSMLSQPACCGSLALLVGPGASWPLRGVAQSESERQCGSRSLWDGSPKAQSSKLHCAPSEYSAPQESDPEGCDEFSRSEAVLSVLMGEGRCHGEEPRLPSRLPSARRWWTATPLPPEEVPAWRCGVCTPAPPPTLTPPMCVVADMDEPCGEDAGVVVAPDSWGRTAE